MKLLWTIAFSIIFLTHVKSQDISGTWVSDWQNQGLSGCYPDNFTITNSSASIIVYSFSSEIFYTYCYPPHNPPMTSNIYSYSNSTNKYYDSNSYFNFTYDPDTDSLSVIFYETSGAYLFNQNGASIPQETALGTIGKTWANKVAAQTSESDTTCCVPDSIFIALANPYHYLQAQFNAVFYYNTTACSQTTNYNFQLSTTNPTTLSWNSTSDNSIFYTPSDDATEWTFLLSSDNGACNYTYTPATTPSDVPSYTWLRDWQTTPDQFSPWNYEVTYKGQDPYSYMISNITFQNGSSYQSFLVQTPQGQYFDPYLNINGTTFSYNSTKNTLLSISTNRATEDALLLSPTGNLFSASDFYSYWTNPVSTNTQALPSDCCVPTYIDIANNASGSHYASVIYYFDANYTSNLGCQDIQHSIDNYQLESTLSIQTPNISQLVWTDVLGNQIYFASPSDTSVIQVSNFAGQCSFNMEMTSTPPPTPTPTPLYSSLESLGSISLVIGLLLVI